MFMNPKADIMPEMQDIMQTITIALAAVQHQRQEAVEDAKSITAKDKDGNSISLQKDRIVHALTTRAVNHLNWTMPKGYAARIQTWCQANSCHNSLGTYFPANDMEWMYTSVAEVFLIRAMKVILEGTKHHIRALIRANQPVTAGQAMFLNYSDKAANTRPPKKDHYPHAARKELPDSKDLDGYHAYMRDIDRKFFNEKRKGKNQKMPKRFQEPGSGKQEEGKKKEHSKNPPAGDFELFKEWKKMADGKHHHEGKGHHGKSGKGKGHAAGETTKKTTKANAYMHGYHY